MSRDGKIVLGRSPFPDIFTDLCLFNVDGVIVMRPVLYELSFSGVSGNSEASVPAGLDSAGENSDSASASKGFLGVVKEGLRNGVAVFVLWNDEVEKMDG